MRPIEICVYGSAQPAGSKRAFNHPHTGRVVVVDANPKSREWKDRVAAEAGRCYTGPLLDCAVELHLVFYRARPKGHMGSGRNLGLVKDIAPAFPAVKPDLTKLVRGAEDALSGIVYRDDVQVCRTVAEKAYGTPERVEITVVPLPQRTFAELMQPRLLASAA
jgi:Holliday junction resolvase RusA-like endonuclease